MRHIRFQTPNPRQELPWAARGIHVKGAVGGAVPGAEEDVVDEVVRIRERIWDVRNGGIAVPLLPFLLPTN